jgi:hypothetical protein
VVIGVHAPEFAFEHETANVEEAVKRYQIEYPVAQDNDFKTWRAYDNLYWPAEYIIDAKGTLRHTHFGEGNYDETEGILQQLLKEAGAQIAAPVAREAPVEHDGNQTPETYVGAGRQERFFSPQPVHPGELQQYSIPSSVPIHYFAVGGLWTFQDEFAQPGADARLQLHFNAKDVYLVMTSDQPSAVDVQLLGTAPPNRSEDLNAQGQLTVDQSRLYHLVHLDTAQEGTLELHFAKPGVKVYAFTFGS